MIGQGELEGLRFAAALFHFSYDFCLLLEKKKKRLLEVSERGLISEISPRGFNSKSLVHLTGRLQQQEDVSQSQKLRFHGRGITHPSCLGRAIKHKSVFGILMVRYVCYSACCTSRLVVVGHWEAASFSFLGWRGFRAK